MRAGVGPVHRRALLEGPSRGGEQLRDSRALQEPASRPPGAPCLERHPLCLSQPCAPGLPRAGLLGALEPMGDLPCRPVGVLE